MVYMKTSNAILLLKHLLIILNLARNGALVTGNFSTTIEYREKVLEHVYYQLATEIMPLCLDNLPEYEKEKYKTALSALTDVSFCFSKRALSKSVTDCQV